ncbi:hypothetical protein BKA93DRAFT_770448 [Sparassis latifolia]
MQVERQCEAWKRARVSQSQYAEQLEWEAHIVEYVNFVHERMKAHGNAKLATERSLRRDLPLYGPRFIPPTYLDIAKRSATPKITPEMTYLKPVTIVHPFYFPEITQCPQCDSGDVKWIQWAATGHREVHGLFREETAIGYQLRCKECEKRTAERSCTNEDSDGAYCFTTTSHLFWQRRDHWEIPYVVLDVWHFVGRYLACIIGGTKNSLRGAVARDLVSAILKTMADKYNLVCMYEKWQNHGDVWSAAAPKVHAEQLGHVKKGCLVRAYQDVVSDGSRIEGSHKGWNNLQQSHASGLEVLTALGHDHVLRRNIRVVFNAGHDSIDKFLASTHGSHHIHLVDGIARLWNSMIEDAEIVKSRGLSRLPTMQVVDSGEKFGLVKAEYAMTYHHLTCTVKDELDEDLLDLSLHDDASADLILRELAIDPALRLQPLPIDSPPTKPAIGLIEGTSDCPPAPSVSPDDQALRPTALCTEPASRAVMPTVIDLDAESTEITVTFSEMTTQPTEDSDIKVVGAAPSVTRKGKEKQLSGPREAQALTSDTFEDTTTAVTNARYSPDQSLHAPSKRKASDANMAERYDQPQPSSAGSSKRLKTSRKITKNVPSARMQPGNKSIHPFFVSQRPATSATLLTKVPGPALVSHTVDTSVQSELVPEEPHMLPVVQISGPSRSQRLFSVVTGINPSSLSISADSEFYLFMDMRAEGKWASFNMTPAKWVAAAEAYNARLEELTKSRGLPMARKTPRALMEKLGELEPKILACIIAKDYTSKRTNTEAFWMKHCLAVTLTKVENGDGKTRKTHTCTRCRAIMYPGTKGSRENHNRAYCMDGVRQKPKKVERTVNGTPETITEDPPEFPQPRGIFSGGTHFHPDVFLRTVEHMYEQLVVRKGTGGALSMEYTAFATLLSKRLKVYDDGMALFELYSSLEIASPARAANFVVERNGIKYLRIDYLRGAEDVPSSIVPAAQGSGDV